MHRTANPRWPFPAPTFFLPVLWIVCGLLGPLAGPLSADILVTREGARIETDGPWQVKGRQVVFTDTRGQLRALRLADIDLEASERATLEASQPPPPPTPEPAPQAEAKKEPVLVLTNEVLESSDRLTNVTERAELRIDFEHMSFGYELYVRINDKKVRVINGGNAVTVPLFHVNHPNKKRLIEILKGRYPKIEPAQLADHFCLVRGSNTLEVEYDSVDRSEPTTLYLKLTAPNFRRALLEMRQAERRSGNLSTTFEVYEAMPEGFRTRRPQ